MSTGRVLIGVDLVWKRGKRSSFVVVQEDLEVLKAGSFVSFSEFEGLLKELTQKILLVFIDAPLCGELEEKYRNCDRFFLKIGIPVLPVNKKILRTRYYPYQGFDFKNFLINKGFKYCGNSDENSFYEVYAFGNASIVFGIKKKRELYMMWQKGFSSLGFTNLDIVRGKDQIDALCCVLPFFMKKWEFPLFSLYKGEGCCMFIPGDFG
ncbi:MAG: hypothetical protein ABIM30_06360 [candidate division WOR-3 bacterium]